MDDPTFCSGTPAFVGVFPSETEDFRGHVVPSALAAVAPFFPLARAEDGRTGADFELFHPTGCPQTVGFTHSAAGNDGFGFSAQAGRFGFGH